MGYIGRVDLKSDCADDEEQDQEQPEAVIFELERL